MNLEAGWQTVIRIRRNKLGRANSKIRMEQEVGEEGQSNAAGKHLLIPCSGSLAKAKVWHKEKFSHEKMIWALTDLCLDGD